MWKDVLGREKMFVKTCRKPSRCEIGSCSWRRENRCKKYPRCEMAAGKDAKPFQCAPHHQLRGGGATEGDFQRQVCKKVFDLNRSALNLTPRKLVLSPHFFGIQLLPCDNVYTVQPDL